MQNIVQSRSELYSLGPTNVLVGGEWGPMFLKQALQNETNFEIKVIEW